MSSKPLTSVKRYIYTLLIVRVVTSKPILLKDFAAHVAEMHENNDHGFEIEYGVCTYISIYTTYIVYIFRVLVLILLAQLR